MRQLQFIAHGEPSDVIQLTTLPEPALDQEDVLISMEAAPLNPSDFLFVRGMYGVRPAFPSSPTRTSRTSSCCPASWSATASSSCSRSSATR